jgi:hypothetical protein
VIKSRLSDRGRSATVFFVRSGISLWFVVSIGVRVRRPLPTLTNRGLSPGDLSHLRDRFTICGKGRGLGEVPINLSHYANE